MRVLLSIVLFLAAAPALAGMTVKQYRELAEKAPKPGTDAVLDAYLDGLADILEAQRQSDQRKIVFQFDGKPYELCPPEVMTLEGGTLRIILDSQLKKGDKLAEQFGPDYEKVPVAAVAIVGIKRFFVCSP